MRIFSKVLMVLPLAFIISMTGCAKRKPLVITPETPPVVDTTKEKPDWTNIPFRDRQYVKTDELQTIYFDFDKSVLKDEAKGVLESNAKWLGNNRKEWVLIEGHCDERGTEEYNIALGERRADSVKKYYEAFGVESKRLEIISWGEEKPAVSGHEESAWSRNRRAETLKRVK